jgi:hypothetical protein
MKFLKLGHRYLNLDLAVEVQFYTPDPADRPATPGEYAEITFAAPDYEPFNEHEGNACTIPYKVKLRGEDARTLRAHLDRTRD